MRDVLTIDGGGLRVRVSLQGGAIVDAYCNGAPLLRPYGGEEDASFDPLKAATFPFVPFGNRVEANRFRFEGREYALAPNTEWDPLYLHGDGWLCRWAAVEHDAHHVTLRLVQKGSRGSPYAFSAEQKIGVDGGVLSMKVSVTNQGDRPLPFGLGHHLFFPLTQRTTLEAPAEKYATEKPGYLPDRVSGIPPELDFSKPRPVPRIWINNGFEGWDGEARICWPEYGRSVSIETSSEFRNYFLFHSDTAFEPDFAGDYFCFEPMTHAADGHNRPDLGGLAILAARQSLNSELKISPVGF